MNALKPPRPTLSFKHLNQVHTQIITNPHQPNILNQLLKLVTQSPTPQNAIPIYNQMLISHPSSFNHYTFTQALKACSLAHAPRKGLEIHAHVIKCGHLHDMYIQNSLLRFYITVKDVLSAHRFFYSIAFPDVVSWTTVISGLSKCGFQKEAIDMFCEMNVKPNASTLVSVLSACSSLGSHKFGQAIHAYTLRNLEESNTILDNAILDFYVRCGSLKSCGYLFVTMPKRDVVSWTTMIGGYAERGFCEEAVRAFLDMVKTKEAEPNEATLVNVLSACSLISALSFGQFVHSYINTRLDLSVCNLVGNAVINMYVKCGDMGMAIQVFNVLAHKDTISWSTVICGMAMNGYSKEALQLFTLMILNGVFPDDVTFVALLSACSHGGLVNQGMMFFKAMGSVYRIQPKMQHHACVVDMYGRAGLLDEAEAFIREMAIKAEWSVWGALLHACRIHGDDKMFDRIRQEVVNTRGVSIGTLALMSNTYASADRWDDANMIRDKIKWIGLKKMVGYSWIEVDPSFS